MQQEVLDRLLEKLKHAAIDPKPSDNLYMESVFPPAFYTELLSRMPEDNAYEFIEHPDAVLPDGTVTRKLFDLSEATIARFHTNDQEFWHELHRILTSKSLLCSILQKFQARIAERYGNNPWPEMVAVPIFYKDYPGYRISEHTDAPFKVATMQFYLPEDESQIHLGTSFHLRENNRFIDLKTNQFKPNSAYAFVRTDNSWHSVKQLGKHEAVRNTLALTIYEKGTEYHATKGYK